MDPMKLYFDVRDIFRAPRLALSGKKILVFVQALLVGYANYLILTYVSFGLAGYTFSETWSQYGLFPVFLVIPLLGMPVQSLDWGLPVCSWQSILDVLLFPELHLNS